MAAEAALFRDTRLRALRESPLAFASTYAKESQLTQEEWAKRLAKWTTPGSAVVFLAFEELDCCGIIAAFRRTESPTQFAIVSMWVAPDARRRGIATRLLETVDEWAVANGASELVLDVTETNDPAIQCYRRAGFEFTGDFHPYPNAPDLRELSMSKML
jgi:ribosomal protein S18 acetylase RimI-like enzyme